MALILARFDERLGEELRDALNRHRLVVVRGREFSAEDQVAIMSTLGPVLKGEAAGSDKAYDYVSSDPKSFVWGENSLPFHSDYMWTRAGAACFFSLYYIDMSASEPTLYTNMVEEERYYESEIHRLKGGLLLRKTDANAGEAQRCFIRPIEIARQQSAKSWELRATTKPRATARQARSSR